METIGAALVAIFVLFVVCGISGFCGWELLEDKPWFWRLHRDSKIRRAAIIAILATIGIPYVWGFIAIGCLMLIFVSGYEIIRYGHTTT